MTAIELSNEKKDLDQTTAKIPPMQLRYLPLFYDRQSVAQQLSMMLMTTTELVDTNRPLTRRLIGGYD